MADNSGRYTIPAPPGTYWPVAFKSNYVASMSTTLTLGASQTITTNLALAGATTSISGSVVDANNSSIGLPGVLFSASANGQVVATFTDTNGNFNVPVTTGTWNINLNDPQLKVHGYVGSTSRTNVGAGATGVTIAVPEATALIYGSVMDNLGNPFVGLDVYADDRNELSQFQADGYTDVNGNYVVGVLGGLGGSDPWFAVANGQDMPSSYIFSRSASTNISVGQPVLLNFTAILATNYITGNVQFNGTNTVGVGVGANASVNSVNYQVNYVNTDANGNYWFNVGSGT